MITSFQAETLLFAVVAALAATGCLYALIPREPTARRRARAVLLARLGRRLATRALAGLALGMLVAVATGWPIAGLGAAVLVIAWDKVAGGASAERAATRRLEALAKWTETLRDTMAGAAGLEQAVIAAARTASPLLAEPLAAMVERLRSRQTMTEALHALADELADPDADVIIAALILNARLRGPGLNKALTALAASARDQVAMRERITAQRGSSRRGVQIIVVVTSVLVTASAVLDPTFVAPYDSALGQCVLAAILALFAAGFAWMRTLAAIRIGPRILRRPIPGQEDTP